MKKQVVKVVGKKSNRMYEVNMGRQKKENVKRIDICHAYFLDNTANQLIETSSSVVDDNCPNIHKLLERLCISLNGLIYLK